MGFNIHNIGHKAGFNKQCLTYTPIYETYFAYVIVQRYMF